VTFISFMLLGLGETALRLKPGSPEPRPRRALKLDTLRSGLRDLSDTIAAGKAARER
jgi:hypothetical protein